MNGIDVFTLGGGTFLQVYLVPAFCVFYGAMLLWKTPEQGTSWAVNLARARASADAWRYAQRAGGAYIGACGLALLLLVTFVPMRFGIQVALEVVLILGMVPMVNLLLKKKFPDGEKR